jgi:REP element-mobilizing transposase RayT
MFAAPYSLDEVQFAYCNRIFLRWRTHRNRPILALAALDQPTLSEIAAQFGLQILKSASTQNELMAQVSMKPDESISTCASKLKGQVSKWLRLKLGLEMPSDLLSKGYFACTMGNSTAAAVEAYLNKQSEHHGYASRMLPPVCVREYETAAADDPIVAPRHAWVLARFHLVFSTWPSPRRIWFGRRERRRRTVGAFANEASIQVDQSILRSRSRSHRCAPSSSSLAGRAFGRSDERGAGVCVHGACPIGDRSWSGAALAAQRLLGQLRGSGERSDSSVYRQLDQRG